MRQVATKSLGVQIPDNNNNNNHSIRSSSSSISANSQQKNHSGVSYNKLVNTNSKKQAANRGVTFRSGNGHHLDQQREQQLQRGEVSPERLNKSREAVKAWLESSSSPEQLDIVAPATTAANELLQGRRSFSSSSSSFELGSGCTSLPNSVTITSSRDDPSTNLRSSGRVIKQLRSRDISPPKAAARAHTPNSQPAKSDVYQLHSGERYRPPTTTPPALSTRRIHHLRDVSEQEGLPAGSSSVTGSDYSLGAEWRAILAAAAQAVDTAAPRLHNHQQLIAAAAAAVDGDGIYSEHSNYYSICAGDEDQEEAVSEAHTVEEFVSCTEHQNSPQLMFLKPPRTMKSKNHVLHHHHHHHHHQPAVASVLVPRELQEDRKSTEEEMKQQLIRPPDHPVVTLVPQPPPLVATPHAITATVPKNMTRNNNYTSHEAQQSLEENLESTPITTNTTITTTNITTVAPKLKAHDNNGGGGGGGLPPRSSKVVAEELTPMQLVLLQVKQHKVESKAAAWERAKCSKLSNRFKREETKIDAWEDHQRARANISLQQVEMKLEAKRAQALEKLQNEMASAHRKAEEKKAVAEAKRAEKAAKAASDAERMRRTGKLPWTPGCLFIR